MSPFTRAVARDFRALLGRCVAGRPRGPAPPVVVRTGGGTRTLAATTSGGVTLTHATPAPDEPDDILVLPMSVLAEVEGGTDEPAVLDRQSRLRGTVRWHGGDEPRARPVELILPGRQHDLPAHPKLTPVSPTLLAALHECGRAAARDTARFALSRVQVRGRAGSVAGTDARVALLWAGFAFPFPDDILVPAVPAFVSKVLARATDVRVGRTATHLVVAAGPWSVWLPTDTTARFPDVAAVVPRHPPTTVEVDVADAAALLPVLSGLPGGDHEFRPVTLDAGNGVRVRGRAEGGETREVPLPRSAVTGPAARVALDRRALARALSLGCRSLRLTPDKPVVAVGGDVTLVAAPLEPDLIAPPAVEPPIYSTRPGVIRPRTSGTAAS